MAAAVSGREFELEPFTAVKAKFDDYLASPPESSEPVDERLVLLGLR